jgi:hypothetical protein
LKAPPINAHHCAINPFGLTNCKIVAKMASVQPYNIAVSQAELEGLLPSSQHYLPDELNGAGWDYGALADIKRLAAYWQDSFDWRKQEAS